jgi:diacylglycerol diphosphate phosphatase/phosphatidate phosphatase
MFLEPRGKHKVPQVPQVPRVPQLYQVRQVHQVLKYINFIKFPSSQVPKFLNFTKFPMFPIFKTRYARLYNEESLPTLDQLNVPNGQVLLGQNRNGRRTPKSRKMQIVLDWLGIIGIFFFVFIFYMILDPPTQYFSVNDTSLMYPLKESNVPSILVGLLSIFLPILLILVFYFFFTGDKWDLYAGIFGAILAYAISLFLTGLLWKFVGGLRPHFLTICGIDRTRVSNIVQLYTEDICLNKEQFTRDTFHGFPSGHASTAFAGCTYTSAYLAAHLKVYRAGNAGKLFLIVLPIILASWMGFSRIADHHHNGVQLFTGILIGIFSAFFAYKFVYVEGFWWGYGRWAHVPYLRLKDRF